jgi:hypothetical protein
MIPPPLEPFKPLRKLYYLPPASDYATHQVFTRLYLMLKYVERVLFEPNIQGALVAQGFKRNYKVYGTRKLCLIRDAVPPPMTDALARFAKEHVRELIALTTDVEPSCGKRKAEEHTEDREAKRAKR